MKNRLLKILGTLTFSFAFIMVAACINVHASWEIISSENGNILKIHNETPGKLYDNLEHRFGYKYEHIVITGEMNDHDFRILSAAGSDCRSIDTSHVKTETIPRVIFLHCPELQKFIYPEDLKVIESNFINCYNLKTVVLPKNLEAIIGSFSFCENLELIIPSGVRVENSFFESPKIKYLDKTESTQKLTTSKHSNLFMSFINWFIT